MKKINFLKFLTAAAITLAAFSAILAQKRKPVKPAAKPKPIIFAVMNDGKTLEPIALIDGGKLMEANSGGDEKSAAVFARNYYAGNKSYRLIFGGADAGTATVKSFDAKTECGKNLAVAAVQSAKAKLKGFVMALATDGAITKKSSGVRRLPTVGERAEIENLVRDEYEKQKIAASAAKNLHYQNLTALDIDADGAAEFVGSFWVEPKPNERALLFFIAEKNKSGKYEFTYSSYDLVTPDKIMSGEIKDVDAGYGQELLLDAFDVDGDGAGEIFTGGQAFEGNNFYVYRREAGKWKRILETYNYHCAY